MTMNTILRNIIITLIFVCLTAGTVSAQTTELTFQGSLKDGVNPANGSYDFQFRLFDSLGGPTQLGSTISQNGIVVTNGIFAVNLDFGNQFPGANRFLEIYVRPTGNGPFTPLTPRQQLSSAPYSVKSLSSDTATNATNAVNATTANTATTATTATNAQQLGGVAANQFVLTTDPRMTDARNPLPNSANYIQNGTSQQAATNFNISGNGTANILNATTQFNLGGNRILSNSGTQNLFAGAGAGQANTNGNTNSFFGSFSGSSNRDGVFNSYFGSGSGQANISGFQNSFFGANAGLNTTADNNSFFGSGSGSANTFGSDNSFFGIFAGTSNQAGNANSFFGRSAGQNSTGDGNTLVGALAGDSNMAGGNNTIIGSGADVGSGALNFATALGSGAVVGTSNTVVLGRAADTVQVPGGLNVAGTFTASGTGVTNLNASNITSGTLNNARLGILPFANGGTGSATQNFVDLTTAQTIGGNKTFLGTLTGNAVNSATQYNISGNRVLSVAGAFNTFAGVDAGTANTGFSNAFFGTSAGLSNLGGNFNSFVGRAAGSQNTDGDNNSFFGLSAGSSNTTGDNNTVIGAGANVAPGNLTYATAIGSGAIVNTSNTVVLGRTSDNVRVPGTLTITGTSASASVHINNIFAGGENTLIGDVGCGTLYQGISFSTTLNCTTYSMLGDGIGTLFNRPLGGFMDFRENNVTQMSIAPGGVVSIFTLGAAGATTLCRNASNQISTCSSSARYKSNINPFTSGLDLIRKLRPVSFNWKEGGMLDMGLVAEEVNAVEPLLTTTNAKGEIEGVKYDRIGVVLVNAVKEQQAQIEAQQKQINEQQRQINALKKLVCSQNPAADICKEER
jgi:hypothetical protein